MTVNKSNHTFAICAYKESEYLEECIKSVINQTVKSEIIITTSTPNLFIEGLAKKYNISLFVNNNKPGIATDWNFAYENAKTKFVTIAHQDDIYAKNYSQNALREIKKAKHPLIFFTDYYELRNGQVVEKNKLLKIKRFLLLPLKIKAFSGNRFIRRRILSLGSAICCPSVAMVKPNLPKQIFASNFRSNLDWQAWEEISKLKGDFLYCNKPLMYHRIHDESETSVVIQENMRTEEDFIMFSKFWPNTIAKILTKVYSKSEGSNIMR